jgi:starvation-inducible DNA-binding protein
MPQPSRFSKPLKKTLRMPRMRIVLYRDTIICCDTFPVGASNTREMETSSNRKLFVRRLNKQLADIIDLRSQARQAHFNVKGPYSQALGSLFDGLARELRRFADLMAERIRALGGHPAVTVRSVALESNLRDYPTDALDAREHLEALLSSYSLYELNTRHNMKAAQAIGDLETTQLLELILISIEKNLWFLEAYLEGIAVGLHGGKLPQWTPAIESLPNIGRNESTGSTGAA